MALVVAVGLLANPEDEGAEPARGSEQVSTSTSEDPTTTTTRVPLMVGLPDSADPEEAIIYEVEGTTDRVSATYRTPGGTAQREIVPPWETRRTEGAASLPGLATGAWKSGDFVSISAQNQRDSGSVTCRISLGDGTVLAEVTSHGAYVIASCDATVP